MILFYFYSLKSSVFRNLMDTLISMTTSIDTGRIEAITDTDSWKMEMVRNKTLFQYERG